MFQVFDLPEQNATSAARYVSTVPTQALTMLNDAFVLRHAQLFADRVKKEAGDDPARQNRSGVPDRARPGRRSERKLAIALETTGIGSLVDFTHVLFNVNEFVYTR